MLTAHYVNSLSEQELHQRIYVIRGHRVMIDRDLAALYGVETKVLNQSVKRNLGRFPNDFMFQLVESEEETLRSQIVTSGRKQKGGRRYPTTAFTELGVAMLSSILSSEQAVQTNIRIMRLFFELRNIMTRNPELTEKLNKLEKDSNYLFEIILHRLDQLESKLPILSPDRNKIGI